MGPHGTPTFGSLLAVGLSWTATFVAIAVAFLVLVVLVRLMLVATKALQVYIRVNSPAVTARDLQPKG
jgi:hypothetical protein